MTEIKASNYSVFVSKDCTKEINRFLKANQSRYSKLFILVDENTLGQCYPQMVAHIPAFEDAEIIEIESGEKSKNIEVCLQIWTTLSDYGADRQSLIVNLGGGVIGDMGGFCASVFKRGIGFINIPTTLLSQVDASIGGKVGVDLNHLKNELGLFSNPLAVFIDTTFLKTLNERQLSSGFAEIIKHALIADVDYWKKIRKTDFSNLKKFDKLIESSIHIKKKIIQEDPFEKSTREMLNFGHTIGHAIETYFLKQNRRETLFHGEAIAIGMICEAFLSNQLLTLSNNELEEITDYILSLYKPVKLKETDFAPLIELMLHDKKNEKEKINFSLISSIGKCEINKTATADLIKEALRYYSLILRNAPEGQNIGRK